MELNEQINRIQELMGPTQLVESEAEPKPKAFCIFAGNDGGWQGVGNYYAVVVEPSVAKVTEKAYLIQGKLLLTQSTQYNNGHGRSEFSTKESIEIIDQYYSTGVKKFEVKNIEMWIPKSVIQKAFRNKTWKGIPYLTLPKFFKASGSDGSIKYL